MDTSEDSRQRQLRAVRAMTPGQRLRAADEMSAEVRALAEAGIRHRRPNASPDEVAEELADLLLGRDLATVARRSRLAARR
jgi:hypothetical protein